nr:unnamed protein product [Naegleria fowleri]
MSSTPLSSTGSTSSATSRQQALKRLPPKVNRILCLKNLPHKITSEELYDLLGKFGAIRQIRLGNTTKTRGTAYVVYEDIFDARDACEGLSGFNVGGRYISAYYFQPDRLQKKMDLEKKKAELDMLKKQANL